MSLNPTWKRTDKPEVCAEKACQAPIAAGEVACKLVNGTWWCKHTAMHPQVAQNYNLQRPKLVSLSEMLAGASWQVAKKSVLCDINPEVTRAGKEYEGCRGIVFYGDTALMSPLKACYCTECGKKLERKFGTFPVSEQQKQEKKQMSPFETLSHNDKATAISKRFRIDRGEVLKWSAGQMLEKWNNPALKTPIAQLTGFGVNDDRVRIIANEEISKRAPAIVQDARNSMVPELKKLEELINAKREVVILSPDKLKLKEMGKQHFKYEEVFKLVMLQLNVWMGGPAGAGKTFLASEIARALDKPFFRISCGPQTAASVIFGHTTASGGYAPGIAYQALTHEKGSVLLFDEFDRLNPAVGVMVNGLLDGNKVTFPNGETIGQREGVIMLVAANTFGKPTAEFGTAQRQDTATMSRFVKVNVPVDEKLEMSLFGSIDKDWVLFVQKVRKAVEKLGVTSLVVTPRASEYGVRMIANGIPRTTVEEMLLWNGIPQDDLKKIKANL